MRRGVPVRRHTFALIKRAMMSTSVGNAAHMVVNASGARARGTIRWSADLASEVLLEGPPLRNRGSSSSSGDTSTTDAVRTHFQLFVSAWAIIHL